MLNGSARAIRRRLREERAQGGRRAFVLLGVAALLAGAAAVSLLTQGGGPPQTAFARAASGPYAVLARNLGDATVVTVVGADGNGARMEIATAPHLPGAHLRGTVSPDGRRVALIAPDRVIAGQPAASLIALDLETGLWRRIGEGLNPLQEALWTPDSRAIIVTGAAPAGAGLGVSVLRAGLDGAVTTLETHAGAFAVAPVGFDGEGRLLAVRLDARGSTLTRAGVAIRWLSAHITRDWALSPDGSRLAFIETNTDQGLRYLPRVVSVVLIEGDGAVSAAGETQETRQALGAAWPPGGGEPVFGKEPSTPPGAVGAQTGSGFDVPLGYSGDGSALVVRHWSGGGFAEPGTPRLEIVSGGGRQALSEFSGFFGWSVR